jgi:choline kinase
VEEKPRDPDRDPPNEPRVGDPEVSRLCNAAALAAADRLELAHRRDWHAGYFAVMAILPAVYLAAGEGKRLRPLTRDRPKAMVEIEGVPLASRALETLRTAGVTEVVAVTGYRPEALRELGELVSGERQNDRPDAENVYSLWCARDVVERGCYVVNSDVLFEEEVARRLVEASGSAVLCARDHGVDEESMKAVIEDGRLVRLSKNVAAAPHPEYIGLTRIDPAHGPLLAGVLERFVSEGNTSVYYESAIEELARSVLVGVVEVDGLRWVEVDDHEDLARARELLPA